MAGDGDCPLAVKCLVVKIPKIKKKTKKKNISQSTQYVETERTEASIFSDNEEQIYYCWQQNFEAVAEIVIQSLLQKLFTSSKG